MRNKAEGPSNEKEVEFGDLDLDADVSSSSPSAPRTSARGRTRSTSTRTASSSRRAEAAPSPEFAMEDVWPNAFIRDYDQDGWPDIYIVNENAAPPAERKIYIAEHAGGGTDRLLGGAAASDSQQRRPRGLVRRRLRRLRRRRRLRRLRRQGVPSPRTTVFYLEHVVQLRREGDDPRGLRLHVRRRPRRHERRTARWIFSSPTIAIPSYIYYNDLGQDSGNYKSAARHFVGLAVAAVRERDGAADFDNDGEATTCTGRTSPTISGAASSRTTATTS